MANDSSRDTGDNTETSEESSSPFKETLTELEMLAKVGQYCLQRKLQPRNNIDIIFVIL